MNIHETSGLADPLRPKAPEQRFTAESDPDMAAFVAWAVKKYRQHAYRHTSATSGEWAAWQAATALERKRCASAAPLQLPPVDGDILPAVGSKVLIHLASRDAWVEHTVAGCYVWPNHGLAPRVFRVFVRVRDADGYLNARSLEDIRYPDSATQHQTDAPVCPWCERRGSDICQHADDARTCEAVR